MDKTGGISKFCQNFGLMLPKRFLGTLRGFKEILAAKNLYGWETGISGFSVDFYRLTVPQTFFGNTSVFPKLSGSEKFIWMREGDITFFSRKVLNHSTGEFHWEIFVVSDTFYIGKKCMNNTGVMQIFVKQFLSPFTEKVHWEHSVFHKRSGSENIAWMREGDITFFCRNFSVSEFRNLS